MSFSKDIKSEILSKPITQDCCGLAFLSGIFSSSASINLDGKIEVSINTDIKELVDYLNFIINKLYGMQVKAEICKKYQIKKEDYYYINFEPTLAYRLLIDTGCAKVENGNLVRCFDVDKYMIKEEHCLKSFVAGVFVGCGTSSIKINTQNRMSTGYHLEFASKNQRFLNGLKQILLQFEINAKIINRKKIYILYVKDANEVSNVLALIGAYNAVLALQNEMAIREVRNKVNRQTNCISANINKTVNASLKQNDAISLIVTKLGLEELSQDLQNVALLRMANPEESLDELVKLATFPITKSGLNYRLNKLIKIADKLKE